MKSASLAAFALRNMRVLNGTHKPSLEELFRGFPILNLLGSLRHEISEVVYDSRKAVKDCLFVAVPGLRHDGAGFVKGAVEKGARAFVASVPFHQIPGLSLGSDNLTAIYVENCRKALAWISRQFYGNPSRDLSVVGITGTNGKTTTTFILEKIFETLGQETGVIGSINYRYGGREYPAHMTTPEAPEINRMMGEMTRAGTQHCFLEVSSHSLSLDRVFGLNFAVAVFTNLTRDHLDFHGTMENYKNAKKRFFREFSVGKRVINVDDPVGREIIDEFPATTLTVGIDTPADVKAENCVLSSHGGRFTLKTPFGSAAIRSHLLGKHNVYNQLFAAAAALIQGAPLEGVAKGLESVERIPGRFEQVRCGQNFSVAVDYAHTDDALRNAINAARTFTHRRVIVVFGCGGDRDRGKRKEMGRAALELADFSVITSDNPRSEDPMRIIADICEGLPQGAQPGERYAVVPDRKEAIEFAVNLAREGDLALIAGKGHEDYQIFRDKTVHFDDREAAAEALRNRIKRD